MHGSSGRNDYLKTQKEINVQYKKELEKMEVILHQRNSELTELRQWKVKHDGLQEQLKGKHKQLNKHKSILKQQEETMTSKFAVLEQTNKKMVQSIQSDFEQKIEKVVENFQNMLKDCEDENVQLKNILQKNIEAHGNATLEQKDMQEKLRSINSTHVNMDHHNKILKQNKDEFEKQITNMKNNYEELKSVHISVIKKQNDDSIDTKNLKNDLRDHGRDLELLMTEYDWLVGKHAYVKSQADFMKNQNVELKQKTNTQMEEIYVNKFKYEMMVKQCQERVEMNNGTQNNYDELKQKYYLLTDRYEKLKFGIENGVDIIDPNTEVTKTKEFMDLQVQLINHKTEIEKHKHNHSREKVQHEITRKKLNANLEKMDHLQGELSQQTQMHKNIVDKHCAQISILQQNHSSALESKILLKKKHAALQLAHESRDIELRKLRSDHQYKSSEVSNKTKELKHSRDLLRHKTNFIKKLELQYDDLKGRHDARKMQDMDTKLEYKNSKYEVEHHRVRSNAHGEKLQELSAQSNKHESLLKRTNEEFDSFKAKHKDTTRIFEEEYKKFSALATVYAKTKKDLDTATHISTKHKCDLQLITEKYEALIKEAKQNEFLIRILQENEKKIIEDSHQSESKLEDKIKTAYTSQINDLENEVQMWKKTNKHIAGNPMGQITFRDGPVQVQKLREIITSNNAKIDYLTTENVKLRKQTINHQSLHELMNDTTKKLSSQKSSFQEAVIKLSNGLKEKEVALMKSELQKVGFKNKILHLEDEIHGLELNSTN